MDGDELATPGYAVLSPATRTKLATLAKGDLMVRHPHFTQPIFLKFPRPAVLRGRDGVERFPQAVDSTLEISLFRVLRQLDPTIPLVWVQDLVALYDEPDLIRARNATLQARPKDVKGFFASRLRTIIPAQPAAAPVAAAPLRALPADDPYGV
jgi:hypothetical protein